MYVCSTVKMAGRPGCAGRQAGLDEGPFQRKARFHAAFQAAPALYDAMSPQPLGTSERAGVTAAAERVQVCR